MGPNAMILVFWKLSFKPAYSLSSFTFIKRLFSSSPSAKGWCHLNIRGYYISPGNLDSSCASSSPAFCMMYSAYQLNMQGNKMQAWRTPFCIWNQSVVPCTALTVASWPAYRFLRWWVRWSCIPISLRIFHSMLWYTQSKGFPGGSAGKESTCDKGDLGLIPGLGIFLWRR